MDIEYSLRLGNSRSFMFFDFFSAFFTIPPLRLGAFQVNVSWIKDYLTGRPQFVKLQNGVSETSTHLSTSVNHAVSLTLHSVDVLDF